MHLRPPGPIVPIALIPTTPNSCALLPLPRRARQRLLSVVPLKPLGRVLPALERSEVHHKCAPPAKCPAPTAAEARLRTGRDLVPAAGVEAEVRDRVGVHSRVCYVAGCGCGGGDGVTGGCPRGAARIDAPLQRLPAVPEALDVAVGVVDVPAFAFNAGAEAGVPFAAAAGEAGVDEGGGGEDLVGVEHCNCTRVWVLHWGWVCMRSMCQLALVQDP